MNIRLLTLPVVCGALAVASGCGTTSTPVPNDAPPKVAYVDPSAPGASSAGLDEKDYDTVSHAIVAEMTKRGLPKGYVVTLGPVDTKKTPYDVDVQKLQNDLLSILSDDGTFRFTILNKAVQGDSAYDEAYKLISYNWENANPPDQESLQKFGKLAKINGILFGRVSSIERRLARGSEVTYTFAWSLGDTDTGLLDVTVKTQIRKIVTPP